MPRRRTQVAIAAAAIALAALTLSSCSAPTTPSRDDAAIDDVDRDRRRASTPTGDVVDITFEGDTVTPNGERVDAKVGQPHRARRRRPTRPARSTCTPTPEQELAYDAGTTDASR